MVTLEQIRQLDARVHRAVEVIAKLREENNTLKSRLSEYQGRIEELEVLISNFKEDQSEIEHGITKALSQLASIDDSGTLPASAEIERHGKVLPPSKPEPERRASPVEKVTEESQREDEEGDDPGAELDIF
jgi:FtsZ-binding cell division protein ZapB